jgi:Secretion system C-terminal sorting domain/Ig-like domain CHU_C associated
MKQILTLILMGITHFSFATFYSGGSGTVADPYEIASKSDLQYLSEHPDDWSSYFVQTANISFTAADFAIGGDFYNNGAGFSPIGNNSGTPFTGKYMAYGYTIDSLYINRPSQDYVGLFGYVYGSASEINALFVTNATVIGKDNTGILIGELSSGTVINSFTSGSVTGNNAIGGVCGFMITNASMERCESNAAISGVNELGGVVGRTGSSSIIYSNSQGTITGTGLIGGLVGRAEYTPISECYSTSNVSGDEYVGGLLGVFDSETLLHCYAAGDVVGNTDVGGLIGLNFGTVQQSFWDTQSTGQTSSQGGTGKTYFEMQTRATFTNSGWDFTNETANGSSDHWKMGECNNNGYPVFNWQASEVYPDLTFGSINGNVLDSATICYDGSATIHASSWNNITWHDSITAGNEISNSGSYTTSNLTETTIFYAQTDNGTCTNPFRLAFTVVVLPENSTDQTFDFCVEGSVTVGNNTYTTTGVYTDLFTAANGCDSTIITHLNIHPELNLGTYMDDEITIAAEQTSAMYQWINCVTNTPIDGENSRFFTATENGEYAVIVTSGPCSDTSECASINSIGLTENTFAQALSVYPNPGTGIFHIQFDQVPTTTQIMQICNMFGEEIFRMEVKGHSSTVDLSNYSNGVYFLSIETDDRGPSILRVVKQ